MNPQQLWTFYFATIAGWQYHPGAGTKEHKQLTLAECSAIADEMLRQTSRRWGTVKDYYSCHSPPRS